MPSVYNESIECDTEKQNSFITAGLSFSVMPGILTARLNILNDSIYGEPVSKTVTLEADIKNEFQILLGYQHDLYSSYESEENSGKTESAVILDEFVLYYKPPIDILIADIQPLKTEDQLSDDNAIN